MTTLEPLLELGKSEEGKDRLRVLLAELLGWRQADHGDKTLYRFTAISPEGMERSFKVDSRGNGSPFESAGEALKVSAPNWPRDLNACHEVEKGLTETQLKNCDQHLWKIVGDHCIETQRLIDGLFWHATATQRTIALILTLQQP